MFDSLHFFHVGVCSSAGCCGFLISQQDESDFILSSIITSPPLSTPVWWLNHAEEPHFSIKTLAWMSLLAVVCPTLGFFFCLHLNPPGNGLRTKLIPLIVTMSLHPPTEMLAKVLIWYLLPESKSVSQFTPSLFLSEPLTSPHPEQPPTWRRTCL